MRARVLNAPSLLGLGSFPNEAIKLGYADMFNAARVFVFNRSTDNLHLGDDLGDGSHVVLGAGLSEFFDDLLPVDLPIFVQGLDEVLGERLPSGSLLGESRGIA